MACLVGEGATTSTGTMASGASSTSFGRRARVNPLLERAGLLADPGVFLELRRPADVRIKLARRDEAGTGAAPAPSETVALDVKVINACGPAHAATGDRPAPQAARYAGNRAQPY